MLLSHACPLWDRPVRGRSGRGQAAREQADALLMAYYPGSEGGPAIADTLVGANEPGGRLPISVPRSEADLPQRHDAARQPRPIGADEHPPS
ncbi:MAG: glycoside hydrolase family 3 C-terminal domain-containing protein, partial [Halobacteriales archaeon]